jgi:hypothetical protein
VSARLLIGGVLTGYTELSVKHDEGSSPRVQLDAQVPVTDWAALTHDPRTETRVVVELTPGKVWCDLLLDEAEINRSSNGAYVHVLAQSDERLVMDRGTGMGRIEFWPADEASVAIARLIRAAQPGVNIVLGSVRASFVSPEDPFIVLPGDDVMSAIDDIADRTGMVVFHDGLVWRISEVQELAGTPVATIRDGIGGTLIDYASKASRADFYNAVLVRHAWREEGTDGRDLVAEGTAWVGSGPLAVNAIGAKVYRVDRNFAGDEGTARRAARSILARTSSRGRALNLTAVADFSLRPGQTIRVKSASSEDLTLISSIDFDLVQHRMQIVTRTPIQNGA